MIKNYLTYLLFFLFIRTTANAQSLGIGSSFNHLSEGILLYYELPLNKNWDFDAGLRIQVNTLSLNKSRQDFAYYQSGYAMHFPEYFGLNFRISRKLIAYKMLRLDVMSNLLITRQSIMSKETDLLTYNLNFGQYRTSDIEYAKAAFAGELTIGLKLKVSLTNRLSVLAASGVGVIIMDYSHTTYSFKNGGTMKSSYFFINKERRNFEWVGLDGLPMMFLGVAYALR